MERNTSSLRGILFDEIDELRAGGDPKRASAVAKLASQIIGTAKIEMDFHRLQMKAKNSGTEMVLGSMSLGTAQPAVQYLNEGAPSAAKVPQQES